MGIQPARRSDRVPAQRQRSHQGSRSSAPARSERAAAVDRRERERRRRERHFRRRRRDLLEDTGLALLLTVTLLSVTAGLGVLALIELPIAAALIGSGFTRRAVRKRRLRNRHGQRRA